MIRLILTGGLLVVLLYYVANNRKVAPGTFFALLGAALGIYFVWNPERANILANMLGVGRGADLIFYCLTLIGAAMLLTVHFRIQQLNEALTALVRETAIANAKTGGRQNT
jgi:hypothetical protein